MTAKIAQQEFHFAETRNDASVRTKVPIEFLDSPDIYLQHVRQMRLSAGDRLTIQAMNEEYDVLLHEAEFLVVQSVEVRRDIQDERGERVAVFTRYKIERRTDWWSSEAGRWSSEAAKARREKENQAITKTMMEETLERATEKAVPPPLPTPAGGPPAAKWNLGHQAYEIIAEGKVIGVVKRREGESKADYKARAKAVARGDESLAA